MLRLFSDNEMGNKLRKPTDVKYTKHLTFQKGGIGSGLILAKDAQYKMFNVRVYGSYLCIARRSGTASRA